MSHSNLPPASEVRSLRRTSVSIDEAIAILLGWITGPVVLQVNSDFPSKEDEAGIDAYYFDLDERICEIRDGFDADLSWAEHEGPHSEAERLRYELARLSEVEKLAYNYRCAIHDELNKGEASDLRIDRKLSNADVTYITMTSLNQWSANSSTDTSHPESKAPQPEPHATQPASEKPWLIEQPNDPLVVQPWYTPARYFARQLVADDPTLRLKRDQLANKVVQLLTGVGIFKRGGKKPFDPGTVKKAFVNVRF